ncbi:MAG: ABC transporter ATP-binding protein [Actinobacteria bacterium]|nr:ABC transporter ATP-binding protein [Actinomycetota bacterium]
MVEVIEFDHVVKKYRSWHERHDSLKSRILNRSEGRWTERTVLNDVSFSVADGSSFAIIGRNGAGKSTALKLISRILVPNSGRVSVTGRVSALLELGAGFHPDLTGRENIFLNGAVLGLSQRTLQERFDDIVEFSGLEDYIENQVKTYSSGMYARLGFAVAVNVDPDILLLDEVLAVGDSAFRQKCRAKISEWRFKLRRHRQRQSVSIWLTRTATWWVVMSHRRGQGRLNLLSKISQWFVAATPYEPGWPTPTVRPLMASSCAVLMSLQLRE